MTEIEGISYTVDANTAGLLKLEKQVATTTTNVTNDLKAVDTQLANTGKRMDALGNTAAATDRKVGNFGNTASQLGFQVQDAAVQLQSGASAFTVLAQQGSQAAAVMGPGGALFGAVLAVAAAIGGVLYNSTQKAKSGVKSLSDELEVRLGLIKEKLEQTDDASKAAFSQVELGKANAEYEKLSETIASLRDRQATYSDQIKQAASPEIRKNYESLYGAVSDQIEKATRKQKDLAAFQERLTAEVLKSRDGWEGVKDNQDKAAGSAEQLAAQIQAATLKLTEGELAARRFAAAQYLGLTNAEQLPPELDAALVKLVQLEEAQKRVNDQKRAELELQREIRSELDKELQAELAAMAAKDKDKKYIGDIMASGDGSQAARVAADAEARIKMLQDIAARDTSQAEAAAEAIILVEQQKQDELTRIATEAAEKRNQFTVQATQTTLGAFGDLFGNLADAAKEGGRDTFQQWKNLASAQAAISTALAFTNTLANPLIPYPLNLALAGSVAALGAVQIAKIQSQQYSGRLYGGPVQAGGVYPITEDGRPEILKQGSRQYLLPGTGGEVISNKDMQAGGGGGSITINYNPTIYAQDADFEAIMAGQPEAVLNAVRIGLASEGRTL